MPFQDLAELDDPTLKLPIRGKVYVIPAPSVEDGRYWQSVMDVTAAIAEGREVSDRDRDRLVMDDNEEADFYRRILGGAYDQMVTDLLPWRWIRHAALTAFWWTSRGDEYAEAYWTEALATGEGDEAANPKAGNPGSTGKPRRAPASGQGSAATKNPRNRKPAAASRKNSGGVASSGGGTSRPTSTKSSASTAETGS